jgi:hypothetical protein
MWRSGSVWAHLIRNAAKVAKQGAGANDILPINSPIGCGVPCHIDRRHSNEVQETTAGAPVGRCITNLLRNRMVCAAAAAEQRGSAVGPWALAAFPRRKWCGPHQQLGERDLRPAAIACKVCHCSKNKKEPEFSKLFITVLQTVRKTDHRLWRLPAVFHQLSASLRMTFPTPLINYENQAPRSISPRLLLLASGSFED